ncbi:MAG: choice-of-anchor Q domain-containing protein, partial [Planctomycetota bacterium]
NNAINGSGGGMRNAGSSPTIIGCTFSNNAAVGGLDAFGGGMYSDGYSHPLVINSTFRGNTAARGAGMVRGTAIGCLFIYNVAESYCGFYGDGIPICFPGHGAGMMWGTAVGCTFVGNRAEPGDWEGDGGGALFCGVVNSILWGNSPYQFMGYPGSVRFSNVQGGVPGPGNIAADPKFVDPGNGDYRLSAGSPCIDAGNNNAIANLADTDFDGNPRFADDSATADTGCGVPAVVDMGAYEYPGDPAVVVFADLDGDASVGFEDFETLMGCWSSPEEPCCVADLDLDGAVDVVDFLILLAHWD